jgi:cytochrome d ubiquinol oxidase subunit I
VQRVKLAAIEAEWETRAPPAAFTVLGIPNDEKETTEYAIHVPWVLGLIATRSTDKEVTGIKDLRLEAEDRIRNGMVAYAMLERLRGGDKAPATMLTFAETKKDLGYALLLKRYTAKVTDATPEQIRQAAYDTIPKIAPLYWSFRVMVGLGMWFILVFVAAFWFVAKRNLGPQRWFFRVALYSIPLPWIASELGWIVAEYGRQPWTIAEMRPTFLSASTLQPGDVWFSLTGFIAFYTALLAVEMYLMLKYIRPGPSSLHSGRYHFEKSAAPLGLQPAVTQQAQAHAGGSEP